MIRVFRFPARNWDVQVFVVLPDELGRMDDILVGIVVVRSPDAESRLVDGRHGFGTGEDAACADLRGGNGTELALRHDETTGRL